jgi:hypothetical protein
MKVSAIAQSADPLAPQALCGPVMNGFPVMPDYAMMSDVMLVCPCGRRVIAHFHRRPVIACVRMLAKQITSTLRECALPECQEHGRNAN